MASDTSPRVGSHPPENTSDTSERPWDAAFQVRRGPGARATALPPAVAGVFAHYEDKGARPGGALGARSGRVYRYPGRPYLPPLPAALAVGAGVPGPPPVPGGRAQAGQAYRPHLRAWAKRNPAPITARRSAVDASCRRRGLGPAAAERADIPQAAPRALDKRDQLR